MNRKGIRANARKNWYQILNAEDVEEQPAEGGDSTDEKAPEKSTDKGAAQVLIYGDIGDSFWSESVPASQFVRDLAAIDADAIDFHIHSPGGDVFDGLAIATAIRTHKAKTTAYVDGLAASAASYIAIAADKTVMAVGAEMMIHDAWGFAMGNAGDMAKMADDLGRISDNIASLYALKAGGKPADWRQAMLEETWYSADEAVKAGLADSVGSEPPAAAKDRFDLSVFAHAGRRDAPAPRFPARARAAHTPPVDAGGNPPNERGTDMASDSLASGLRNRLGIAADVDEPTMLAALDEALAERAEPSTAVPTGAVLIDAQALADLRAAAAQGVEARQEQVAAHRAAVVDAAIDDGRISRARRDYWLAQLTADPGAEEVLASFEKGLAVPVGAPTGYTGGVADSADDDRLYRAAFGEEG